MAHLTNGACADPQVQSGFVPNDQVSLSTPLILSTMTASVESASAPSQQPVERAKDAPTGTIMADGRMGFVPPWWLLLLIIVVAYTLFRRR